MRTIEDRRKLYIVFRNMKSRCSNPKVHNYSIYGGKGIRVEWDSFEEFFKWSLDNGYKQGLQIDRIDSDKNYCPSNCRFITAAENQRNKKSYQNSQTPFINVYRWPKGNRLYYVHGSIPNKGRFFKGGFKSPEDAARARDRIMIENNVICKLNFPELCAR